MDSELPKRRAVAKQIIHLSVVVSDDNELRILNRNYRGKDKPTDVLSFSQTEGEDSGMPSSSLGDVIISIDTAKRQALEYQVELYQEILRLFIHGILHLCGYDHENVPQREVRAMQKMEDLLQTRFERKARAIIVPQ